MKHHDPNRRRFLRLLMSLSAAGLVIGLDPRRYEFLVYASNLTPQASLEKLILMLGPWPAADRQKAADFARRFLKAKHAVGSYLPDSSGLVQSLASRFPDDAQAIKEIDLKILPAKERELLMKLVRHLYSLIEIRFDVSNWPPWGECLADETRHTRAPSP